MDTVQCVVVTFFFLQLCFVLQSREGMHPLGNSFAVTAEFSYA